MRSMLLSMTLLRNDPIPLLARVVIAQQTHEHPDFRCGVGLRPGCGNLLRLLYGYVLELPHRFVMGLLLGWLRARSNSLAPCVLAHFTHNLLAILIVAADHP